MSHQICTTCGDDFSGEDEDSECDDCAINTIETCERTTGHLDLVKLEGELVCRHCHVFVEVVEFEIVKQPEVMLKKIPKQKKIKPTTLYGVKFPDHLKGE